MTTYSAIASLPRPELTDTPNAPTAFTSLTDTLDPLVIPKFASTAARNTAIPSPTAGQFAYITGSNTITYYDSGLGAWLSLLKGLTGRLVVTGSGNIFTRTVTFSQPFATAPKVFVNITSSDSGTARAGVRAEVVTTTGFQMFFYYEADGSGTTSFSSIPVDWVAFGT